MSRFSFLVFLIWLANCDNISSSVKIKEISSVVSSVGQIPCSAEPFHDVAMILWFKDSSGTPIYSYDARSEEEDAKHMTLKNDWGLRLYFRVWPSSKRPPALIIRDLQIQDGGLYRCRVDFRNAPTTNAISLLKVVQPPTHLEIRDASQNGPISDQQMKSVKGGGQSPNLGANDITYMGPYIEGQNITVVCSAYGGLPIPEVIWYWNGKMVDNTYELVGNNYATNELSITLLGGTSSQDLYTCQASNNNETKPISHRVNFDVYLTVKHIEVEVPVQMTAGDQYNLVCRVAGAYPTVKMEFWKSSKRIGPKYQIKSDADNVTTFIIPFKPEIGDDEAIITCNAMNPWITQHFMETSRKLHVYYVPTVVLRFASSKTTNFSEGESLLMECHVKANPPIHSTQWFHEGRLLQDDASGRVRVSGMTLFIRHLSHTSIGSYWCESANDVGLGTSNSLDVVLNIAPKCANQGTLRVSLTAGESHHLPCNILAWPSDLNFYWTLNRSTEILPIPSLGQVVRKGLREEEVNEGSVYSFNKASGGRGPGNNNNEMGGRNENFSEGAGIWGQAVWTPAEVGGRRKDVNYETVRHQAVLRYQVKSDDDFGVVACWARNSYGKQLRPCLFQIIQRVEAAATATAIASQEFPENGSFERMENITKVTDRLLPSSKDETFLSKLAGSVGIILIGLLIFITATSLALSLWLFLRRRRRAQTSTEPSPSIRPTFPDAATSSQNALAAAQSQSQS